MAIKLDVYLKRTNQTLSEWMDANGVTKPEELLPRCAYVGLAAGPADVVLAKEVFKGREKAKAETTVEVVEPVVAKPARIKRKKEQPAEIDLHHVSETEES